jgi:ribosomal protein S18 acetylase RimI-like enzyme
MAEEAQAFSLDQVAVRLAAPRDHAAVRQLFQAGLEEGHVPDNDTGADIDNIVEAYFSDSGQSGLWVADCGSGVIGMVGVQKTSDNEAEIRRLRVHADYRRRGVGTRLMEQALSFCRQQSYLKVILELHIERGPAISLFRRFGFRLNRMREVGGRKMLDFYLDLYREPGA